MFSLTRQLSFESSCPYCHTSTSEVTAYRFTGAAFLATVRCAGCQQEYIQTLPIGHYKRFPVQLTETCSQFTERGRWVYEPLHAALFQHPAIELPIEICSRHRPGPKVVIVNTLDSCYGHVLAKVFDVQRHYQQHPEWNIIVLVPEIFAWLVPDYVAEVWVIKGKLSQFDLVISNLDTFIKEQLTRFTDARMSESRIHFSPEELNLTAFIKTPAFSLPDFSKKTPQVTLICREDRLWLRTKLELLLYRLCKKVKLLQATRFLWVGLQNLRWKRTVLRIHKKRPDIKITAVGLGKTGSLAHSIQDKRVISSPVPELDWCQTYASSQVIVGVHGSNMLIPTGLGASFINLVPPEKIGHLGEDILLRHCNPILQSVLGRFLPTSVSPSRVADHVLAIFEEFPVWWNEYQERVNDGLSK
ncbi:MAG: hypothetical protein QM669_00570 [Siphonobacter sp.]